MGNTLPALHRAAGDRDFTALRTELAGGADVVSVW